jgi:hypothetical protein
MVLPKVWRKIAVTTEDRVLDGNRPAICPDCGSLVEIASLHGVGLLRALSVKPIVRSGVGMAEPTPLFREGFQVRENNFVLPELPLALDPRTKRELTICNLFVNHELTMANIKYLLDEDLGRIVQALIDHKIVQDRRQKTQQPPAGGNRRTTPRKVQVEMKRTRWRQA